MIKIDDNLLEWLKWFALILMTADHINKYIFQEEYEFVFYAGRMVMPLFAFILAYNLSRPSALVNGAYQRTMKRLAFFGLIATPAYIASGYVQDYWFPLNIMFLLLVCVAIAYCLAIGDPLHLFAALMIFVIGGAITEFWYFGIVVFLASKKYVVDPSAKNMFLLLVAIGSLAVVNGNLWALAAAVFILLAIALSERNITIPKITRSKKLFYIFYPAHLTLIVAASKIFF